MMKDMRSFDRRAFVRAAVTLILALCLCLSLLSAVPVSADTQEDALGKLVGWGVMNGYPDGSLRPKNAITRAEFVALVNRAYGYHEIGNMPFLDVPYTSWYYDDISIAYNARYFDGTSTTTASPQANLSREQAMTLLARGMRLDSIPGEVTEFSDGRSFSTWSRGYVKAAYRKGLIGGYSDGSFKPKQNITRGEMAILLTRALGTLVHEQGEHTLGSVYGNVTINTPGTTLYDTTIMGDLYITGGLGLGSVELDNVRVLGSIIVAGGGESEAGQDSVVLRNVRADELKIDSLAGQYLTLRAEGDTVVTQTNVRTDCYIQDRTQAGQGLLGITLEGANGNYTLAGNLETVVNKAPNSSLKIARGTLGSLTIDETATGSQLTIESDATVKEVNLDTAVNVTGGGDVGSLNVNAAGSSTSMLPDDIYIRPGITANVYNETMDTELGQEASSAPRILAGYPKASDVAPTTMTATVATNKSGTLYWAVSSITDGSVGEEGLLSPAAYGSKAVKYGTLQVGKSNTDINISVTGLTTGGNYYFSAMLVDARNDRSPVKVISFSTPDNTVPAFASGYPSLVDNSYDKTITTSAKKYYADFTVKSTKSCNLYWVVYTKGSTAPTAAELRSGSLAGSVTRELGRKIERNEDAPVHVNGLEELTDYDIYFWLNDFDNTKSSAVKKLTFKTVDGTPPVFVVTPTSVEPQATSLKLTMTVNENATVYWVAVTAGADYPQGRPNTVAMSDLEYAIFQVENGILGSSGVKSGKVTARANTEATINVTGLKAETAYDIWYVAKDTAGNYSAFNTIKRVNTDNPDVPPSYVRANTRDVTAPTVTQEFSKTDSSNPPRPYPDSVVSLVFSEDVQRYSKIGEEDAYSLLSARGGTAAETSEKIRQFLLDPNVLEDERVLTLHTITAEGRDEVFDGWYNDDGTFNEDIMFSVRLDTDGRRVIVDIRGLELNSGTYYYFELKDLADTSNAQNRMREPYTIEQFQTVSSKVILDTVRNLTEIEPGDIVKDATAGDLPSAEKPVEVDMAFKFMPDATTTDNGSRDWDMIIWSDTTVEFQLYRRFVPVDDISEYAKYKITEKDTKWNLLPGEGGGSVTYTVDSATFRLGKVLHYSFEKTSNYQLRNLPDDDSYFEYAVHFLSIKGDSDRDAWDQDVKFTVNVVAGTGVRTAISSQYEIREDYYNSHVNNSTYGVEEISEPLSREYPFTLEKSFIDTKAPEFYNKSPTFIRTDTSLTMMVNLERAGTIFWVATPVGSISSDTDMTLSGTEGSNDAYGDVTLYKTSLSMSNDRAENIRKAIESSETNIDPDEAGYTLLTSPNISAITNPDNKQPMIKTGSASIGSTTENIEITDLEPGTAYFIYVVLRGSGSGSYSPQVKLYKVATRPSPRPVISLGNSNNAVVSVTTRNKDMAYMASHVNYMVMRYWDEALESSEITNVLHGLNAVLVYEDGRLNKDVLAEDITSLNDMGTEYEYKGMTLLEAMSKQVHENSNAYGSVFDAFVKQTVKNSVSNYIASNTSKVGEFILGGNEFDLPTSGRNPSYTDTVNCEQYDITPGMNYVFLATATNVQGTETGFGAIYPVVVRDDSKPSILNIFPELELVKDDAGNDALKGTLRVLFDRELYYNDRTSSGGDNIKPIIAGTTASPEGSTKATLYDVIESVSSGITYANNSDSITNTVNFTLDAVTTNPANIMFKTNLSNYLGTFDTTYPCMVRITRRTDPATSVVYADVYCQDWTTKNEWKLVDTVALTEVLTLNTTSAFVPVDGEYQLSTNASGTVAWTSNNTKVAAVDKDTGKVTGVSKGTATITAKATSGNKVIGQATCTVTVTSGSLTLSENSLVLTEGETRLLTATTIPESASANVSWKSSNEDVAMVVNGTVSAKKAGTATITASVTIGTETIPATCTVTVIGPTAQLPEKMSIPFSLEGESTISFEPSGFDVDMIKSVTWDSDTPSVASATNVPPPNDDLRYATLSVQGPGTAKIHAEILLKNGTKVKTNNCTVTVTSS